MLNAKSTSRTLLLATALCTALGANAQSCYEKSPNLEAHGDDYYDLAKNPAPSPSDLKTMTQYFKSLEGDWEGTAVATECFGNSKKPEERHFDAQIEAKVASGNEGALNVDYEFYNTEKKTRQLKKIRLDGSKGNQVFRVRANDVTSNEKFRIRNRNGSSRLIERYVQVSGKGEKLSVEITNYTNGYLSEHETWTLKKE